MGRARTKSSPTASKTFGFRPNGNPPLAGNNTGASRLLRALRARTKSSPTASKTIGLRPNGNPPSAGNNCFGLRPNGTPPTAGNNPGASRLTTGASRPNKELAYGEQNLRPSAEWKHAFGGQ